MTTNPTQQKRQPNRICSPRFSSTAQEERQRGLRWLGPHRLRLGAGDVTTAFALGRQVKNRCKVTRFEFSKYHPGVRRRAVVAARPPVRDTVLLQVRQWYEMEEHGRAPLFCDVPMIAVATAVVI